MRNEDIFEEFDFEDYDDGSKFENPLYQKQNQKEKEVIEYTL